MAYVVNKKIKNLIELEHQLKNAKRIAKNNSNKYYSIYFEYKNYYICSSYMSDYNIEIIKNNKERFIFNSHELTKKLNKCQYDIKKLIDLSKKIL